LIAGAVIPPLRHPLLIAKEIATLDLLCTGRLVVQPTVSWHRAEYEALGVPFETRGRRLDEHLDAWNQLWRGSPASFRGRHYAFDDVWLEPKPFRPDGPRLWFGGQRMHDRLLRRLVAYGHGFNPLGLPSDDDLERLATAMAEAGREPSELEMVGGTRGSFPDAGRPAPLEDALDQIRGRVERGFGTICFKPSQFVDDPVEIPDLLRRIVEGTGARVS
jgi:alkanesulfonate monooxygenase SsuD/methylene tetrahydromethanopterin reductase-like flavin-dependent oxidoreductase (luciferase family)